MTARCRGLNLEDNQMNAFEHGWMDCERGKLFKNNPYFSGTPDWLLWRNGYRAFCEAFNIGA